MRPGIGGIRPSCTCFVYLALLFGLLAWSPSAEEECRDDQFQCNDGSCIQGNWACDGSTDCSDESDEFEENCPDTVSTRKKRYSTADGPYDEFHPRFNDLDPRNNDVTKGPSFAIPPDSLLPCLPNYKRCPKEDVCIPIFKFCDKRTDCRLNGDEEGCSAPVSNCDSSSCSHACQLTPDGPECYCPYQKQPNNTKCTDIDMCSYPQFCDQHCISKEGKFSCACSPGYTLMRDLHCIAENVPRNSLPTLLIADFMRFHQVALNGMQLMPPVVAAGQAITTLDFNHRKQFACWLSYQLGSKISVMECLDLKNTSNSWKMKSDVSLDNVVQIAFDWITENWYLADKLKERIILCNSTMGHCRMVLDLAKYEIFSIRVDPTAGYIFILTKSSVLRARLDGSNLHVIHKGSKTNMERPQDMTLDFANRHVYWTDSQSMIVMRMDYDGHSPFVIYSRLRATKDGNVIKGFGISILQNKLFLTSQEPASLSAVHRFNYAEGAELLTRDLEYPYQVHVYHRVRQPDLPGEKVSPCTPDTCEHLCVVMMDGDTPTAKCLCAAGYVMGNDSKCKVNTSCPGELNCQDVVCSWPVACNVSTPCEEGYIRCPRGSCVPKGWWCDGQEDCSHAQDAKLDMADEKFCGQRTCSVDEFRCMDGNCMPREFLCDGQAQCADKSDEKSCHNNTLPSLCNNDEFRCNNGSCLKQPLRCNGQRDCPNGSDEEHCEKCEAGQFRCLNGQCIAGSSQCDGKDDCLDSSDENLQCFIGPNVTYHQCKPDSQQFHCGQKEKRCIPLSWKCDGEMDCVDHSDEAHCNETCDGPTKFQCHNNESCLLIEKACNGLSDCTDGSDELGCKSCEVWGVCSQVCTALPHNKHSCSCYPGYQLKTDGSCKPTGSEPVYIIFSNQHQMRRVELTNYTYASLVSGLKNTIALDFFYDKSYIFWTDVVDDKIFRGTMLGNTTWVAEDDDQVPMTTRESLTNIEPIIDVGLATTEGLAIDWIGENIYWVESNLDQIEVAKLDGSYRTTFIAGDMVSPRAIVVDPREGALFWTDWDSDSPRIETCSMSGQGRKLIFKIKGIVGAGWPNGLTIDYDFRRLYWIDARSDSIHTIKYDGSSHRLILKGHDKMRHPFALTLFGNYVYWTDWSSSALLRANKFNGSDVTVIQKTVSQPFDLQVYHPLRQPKADNPCGDNNGGCSHLCLIGYNQSSTCMCPHLFKLREDNMTCETDNTFLLFVKTSEIRGVDLQDANYNVIPTITIPNVDHPTAIDYDLGAERLYWADSSLNVINSAFINGSGVETIIDSGISSPHGFAIDWLSKNMYFSSQPFDRHELKASISVAKLNGAFRAEITPEIIGSNPQSLAVLPSDGYLFWADQSATATSIICRSKMDGTEGSVIVGNLSSSVSIQLDVIKKRLFWIELGRPKIYMSDIDGKNQRHLHHLQLVKLQAFTYYKDSTFYVSHNTGKLSRFSFTDIVKQMKHHLLREKTEGIMALKVFDHTSRINDSNGCSKDNGKCAQLCLPTGPSSFVCKCTAGYRINGTQCTSIDSFLMYSSNSEIHGISFDLNDTKTKALPLISKISKASSIDFNAATDDIYWVDAQSNTVSRVKRDLTKRNTIVHQEIRGIQGMAVDWISGNVYWTDFGSDVIEVVRLTNIDHRFVVIHGQINDPRTIVLHPEAGLLFWTDTGTPPKIERARLDGTERKTIVNTDIKEPFGLAIDYDRNVLYWCDHKLQKIEAIDIATGNRTVLLQGEPHVNGSVSLTFYDDHIYWLEDGAVGKIKRINLDGSNLTVVRSKLGPDMQDIKAYHTSKQKGDNPCRVDNGGCQEFCFHIGNGTVSCNCSYGKVGSDGKTCEGHDSFLLFSKVTDIASISLDENNPNLPMKTITNVEHLRNVIGLATDHKTKRIFFSDIQRGDIQYINFNSSIFHVVAEGVGSVEGLAYDAFEKYLYWTSYTNSSISRINPDVSVPHSNATVEKIIQLGVLDHPRAIAIDSCSYRMFWTNWHDDNPQIQRSFLNGLKPESIITNDIWTPNGLTIDHREQQLYWSDARLDKIERCDFDGKNRKVVVSTMPEHPFSLAVYGQYIYWTDWIRRAVMRSNKYDGSNVFWMKRNLERQPMGITVVAEDANNCTVSRCHNHGCEDICKVINERAQCSCKKGILLSDGQRCGPANASCGALDFVCHNRMACIPIEKRCNNFSDCSDGSDESPRVCTNTTCEPGLFTCKNFACIHIAKFCDGTADCSDGSDELQCTCERDQFQCKSGQCIHRHYRCDRDKDCPDFDDELGCNMTCDNLEMFDYEEGVVSCNTTSQCIQESWICDGNTDCWDNNDENHCDNKTNEGPCADNGFKCTQSGACIPAHWECDNDNDCGDHSDEENCNYTCEAHMFQCNHSKVCLPRSWECDGHPDCANHTDEGEHCKTTTRSCQDTEYHCNGTGRCIPIRWKCDGDIDCPNGEDEHIENGCPPVLCKRDEYMCKNRRCIRNIFVCDRDDDCGDNSDEPPSCVFTGCGQSQFQCKQNGTCIAENLRCNGFPDCPDHSDEANCTTEPPCSSEDSFKCDSGSCIHIDAVCDGQDNCGDASDEPENCHINECFFQHRMCSHECVDMKIGYRCGCDKGYKLREDGKTCEDINECEEWPMYPCSHFCINTVGSFHCTCAKGYTLANNGLYCKADGDEQPFLIVANRYFLKRVTFKGVEEVITEHLHNAVAVGFDYQEKRVYWTDVTSKSSSINRMKLPNGTKEVSRHCDINQGYCFAYNHIHDIVLTASKFSKNGIIWVIHNSTVRNPDGLAIDWVGRNLYWCDKTTDTIEVSKLDGRYRKVLIKEGLQEPRALEVFPAKGYMFYTDWGESPHISRSYLDGSITEKIITEDLAWPNALTIDYVTEKIFWADASLDYIAMANLDGSSRHLIIDEDLPHTFAVTTFMNYIYWTDWEKGSIIRAQKFSGENRTVVATVIHRLMDIQVYHKMRQVEFVPNPCENNGGCSHLCLLRPLSGVFAILGIASIERVCACPENHDLLADGRTCLANCTSSQFLCTRSSKCIPFWWKCDRQWDCEDGSDEPANCPEYKCSHPGLFRCKNSTMECLAPDDICNGKQECSDGSDEEDCESFHCLAGSRKCPGDDICMPESNFCDSKDDCPGGKDEHNCTHLPCNKNNFQCKNKRCLPYMWLCDKDQDCGDGSDESDDFCYNRTCLPGHAKCDTGRCIPENWQCDGDLDCGQPDDHSDEDMSKCNKTTCDPTYFQCDNKHCIPGRWQCDYDNDCRDGSDERGCAHRVCTEHEFNCSNNKCIPKSWQCNGEMNCEDGSDERDCVGRACNTTEEFQCGGICITKKWLCDDDIDCPDGSDERNCANSCSVGKFLCKNKHCVPEMWRCDGDDDCGDGTDEDVNMCKDYPCPLGRFRCNNHKCSFMSNRCDGVDQCGDGTDEENCYYDTICHGQSFRCQKNDKCIPIHKVCDGEHNCMDHSDEATAICSPDNIRPICTKSNRCQQLCQNILGVGYKCGCKMGYKLSDNGYSCHEINLCQIWGTCSQGCSLLQTLPRHLYLKTNCSCDQGYFMGTDNETLRPTCRARGPKPQLVIAHETELIQSDITRGNNGEEQQTLLGGAHEHSKILSIDVDMSATSPLWTGFIISYDKTLKKMTIDASNMAKTNTPNKKTKPLMRKRRSNIDLKVSDPQKFVEGVADPKGIAVDWVGKSVYWTDAGTHTIEMTDYLGNRRITLIDTHLKQPYSIVVAPEVGKLFWTDQGYPPKIQSSNLDGSGRKDVVKDAIIWPNGLVIDQANYRLYWTDTKKHTVETISLNGDDRHVVKTFNSTDPPFMIDVFEDYLYVTLYRSHSVVKIHKFGDRYMQKTEVLITNVTFIGDIIILQHNRQKSSIINYCATNSTYDGPCTAAFCVNMPLSTGPKYTCLCPNNAVYEDGKCSFRKSCEVGYCKNGGSCHPQANGNSKCRCQAGLSGERCEKCDSNNYCHNGGQCRMSEVGVTCRCLTNFTGARCESCIESACQNGGTCQIVQGQISCQCPNGSSGNRCQLANQCEQFCNNGGTCDAMSNAVDDPSSTKYTCTCTPDWTGSACDVPRHQCAGRCKNNGTCTMDKDGNARCTCIDVHGGPTCEACQCKLDHGMCGKQDNGTTVCMCEAIWKGRLCDESICDTYCSHGECNGCFLGNDSTAACKSCVCRPDYQGSRCEKSAQTQQSSENILLQVLVPVIAIILLLIIIIITLFIRKKRDQFKHHRMLNTSLETANPIFLAQQAEDENGDMSPMEVYDDDGDTPKDMADEKSTNFANPMYNRLYSSESTQVLLPKDQDNNEPYDGNGDIHYYNKNDKTNGKIAYA